MAKKKKISKKQLEQQLELEYHEKIDNLMQIPVGDLKLILQEFGFGIGIGPMREHPMSAGPDEDDEPSVSSRIGFQPNDVED